MRHSSNPMLTMLSRIVFDFPHFYFCHTKSRTLEWPTEQLQFCSPLCSKHYFGNGQSNQMHQRLVLSGSRPWAFPGKRNSGDLRTLKNNSEHQLQRTATATTITVLLRTLPRHYLYHGRCRALYHGQGGEVRAWDERG